MPEPRSWLLWSSKPGVACFDGPAIRADESVRVLDAAQVAAELAELRRRLENASAVIAAYQKATGTDYAGSLRLHQRQPDLIKAGRAYREQWGIQEALDAHAELDRLRRIEAAARELADALDDEDGVRGKRCHCGDEHCVAANQLRDALEEQHG